MAKSRSPRHGSMQFWPRVRAKKETPRVRSWSLSGEGLLGFAGYKAGMTQIQYVDPQKTSLTKGQTVSVPVTIIECPPINIIGVRLYCAADNGGIKAFKQINAEKVPADVKRRLAISAKVQAPSFEGIDESIISQVRLLVSTQPKLAGFGKKTADIFELAVGGDVSAQLTFAKENLGKTISVEDVFKSGDLIDTHGVTTGKGYQGSVKRFGVNLTAKKSEKIKRGPGSLGPWKGQGHIMYRVPMSGKMGYHLRTDYNKRIELIDTDIAKINPASGISHYGLVKSTFILVKGSVSGPKKRLVALAKAVRPNEKYNYGQAQIEYVSVEPQN